MAWYLQEILLSMNRLIKISVILCGLLLSAGLSAQNESYDAFVPIAKYLGQGNAERLSAWFSDNLEVTVFSTGGDSSKNQAKQMMKSFFESHTPRSFNVTHTAGKSGMKYALGTLDAGGEQYQVTIFISVVGDGYKIQQLKIERGQ